jgi:outer membrane putative beta-barrel porin/alpha-amylase
MNQIERLRTMLYCWMKHNDENEGTLQESQMRVITLLTFALTLLCSQALAYPPFVTEDAGVAEKGETHIEVSWDHLHWKNAEVDDNLLLGIHYGMTEKIELAVEIPYLIRSSNENESGIGDINLWGKYLILPETEGRPAFTVKGIVKFPTGDKAKGLGSGGTDGSLLAVASKQLGRVTLHTNLGYAFVGKDGSPNIRNIYLYGLAADLSLTQKIHFATEIAGNRQPDLTIKSNPLTAFAGIIYNISNPNKASIYGGVRFGLNNSVPKWNTTTGATIPF